MAFIERRALGVIGKNMSLNGAEKMEKNKAPPALRGSARRVAAVCRCVWRGCSAVYDEKKFTRKFGFLRVP